MATVIEGSSESRFAMTSPLVPPPTITVEKSAILDSTLSSDLNQDGMKIWLQTIVERFDQSAGFNAAK